MITGQNHITLAVLDIERSFVFYRDVLGLTPIVKWNKGAYFLVKNHHNYRIDDGFWFCLNVDKKRKINECCTHYAFSVSEEDFDALSAKIIAYGAHIYKKNSSPGKSLYFLDPDGHKLEIHVGNWQNRVTAKKNNHGDWQNVEWYIDKNYLDAKNK